MLIPLILCFQFTLTAELSTLEDTIDIFLLTDIALKFNTVKIIII
jgi:hypothetical protein